MKPDQHNRARPGTLRERGLAMVEFVIGMPVVFLLLYGTCEFSNAFVQYSELADAARNADRYLASNALLGSTGVVNLSPQLTLAAQNLVVYGNTLGIGQPLLPRLRRGQVTVTADAYNNVSVLVVYHYQSLFGGEVPYFVRRGGIDTRFLFLTVYTTMVAL
jgi:Flp pilus assembly protein TadG